MFKNFNKMIKITHIQKTREFVFIIKNAIKKKQIFNNKINNFFVFILFVIYYLIFLIYAKK